MKSLQISAIILLLVTLTNCTGDLPLSDLINNTVTLKVLGTYESNDPYPLQHAGAGVNLNKLPVDDAISNIAALTTPTIPTTSDLYQYVTSGTAPYKNLQNNAKSVKYYIDIAEIRLAQGQGKSSSQTISDYWSQFAISRQLMCSDYDTADGRTLSNCSDSNGIQRLADFFNGGFAYPAVDVASGSYNHMGIYFRRFATYPAAFFTGEGKFGGGTSTNGLWDNNGSVSGAESLVPTTFDNRSIYGQDIESLLQNQYNETATEPRMFPLQRKDLSLKITNGAEPYVLEVRIFLQNLMMVHMRQITNVSGTPSSTSNGAFVYVAPSDWNINHAFLETENNGNSGNSAKQGGSVIMTARAYQPANVGRLVMDATFTPGAHENYFVAVPTDTTIDLTTTMPLVATRGTNNVLSNLQPGSYYVYRTCDVKKCDSTSTAGGCSSVTGQDGFPESFVACHSGNPLIVTKGTDTQVLTASCNTIAGCT